VTLLTFCRCCTRHRLAFSMVCAPQSAAAVIMPQRAAWGTEDMSKKAVYFAAGQASDVLEAGQPATVLAEEAVCQRKPPSRAQKDRMKLQKKLREIAKIEEADAKGDKVDPLQRQKLVQKEALMAQLEQAGAVAEEEARTAMEEGQQEQKQQQQQQQQQFFLDQQEQRQQTISEVSQCSSAPVTKVESSPVTAPICDGFGPNVQHEWFMQACPVLAEQLPVVAPGCWMLPPLLPQQQQQQQQQEQQRLYMQVQVQLALPCVQWLPSMQMCKEHSGSLHSCATQQEPHEDAASLASRSGCIETLMEMLKSGTEARQQALASLRGSMVHHAFEERGCRAVQLAFEVADRRTAAELLLELKGHVVRATESPHANFVIQKAIEVLPPSACRFVAEEIRGAGTDVARHCFGCRILQRLLQYMVDSPACVELIDEVLADARQLCCHLFGHYVMQAVLEHGQPHQRGRLYHVLTSEGPRLVGHVSACYVLEDALRLGSEEDQQSIGAALLASGGLVELAMKQYGSFVVRALLRSRVAAAFAAAVQLHNAEAKLQKNRHGRRVLHEASSQ